VGVLASCVPTVGIGLLVRRLAPGFPYFEPAVTGRGPAWPMSNWVVHAGLRRYGFDNEAAEIRHALLELVRREGFWEHYNAATGRGQGTEQVSWTAALVLDLLEGEPDEEGGS
jgi:glycogen debranching enzyme